MAFDKVVDSAKLDSAMTATADAIRGKTGSTDSIAWDELTGFASSIDEISGGGNVPVVEKDVNFYDYDGTLLYSYTLDEVQALTELPPEPDRSAEGLVCQGWNWTLDGLKIHGDEMNVAAMYDTEDGATWFVLDNDLGRNVEVSFMWNQSSNDGVVLDFGDGFASYNSAGTGPGLKTVNHTYAPGKYTAKLSGEYNVQGNASQNCINDIDGTGSSILRRVHVTCGFIGAYSFKKCVRLEAFSVSKNTNSYGAQIFYQCNQLKFVTHNVEGASSGSFGETYGARNISFGENIESVYSIPTMLERVLLPNTVKTISVGLSSSYRLKYLKIPPLVTTLPQRIVQNCFSLVEFTVPEAITTINAYAFNGCICLRSLRFKPTTPPTVANANAFTDIPTDCIVEVPAGKLATYQAATNYATIAAQMVEANE